MGHAIICLLTAKVVLLILFLTTTRIYSEKPKTITVEREITEADLNKLRMKFNIK